MERCVSLKHLTPDSELVLALTVKSAEAKEDQSLERIVVNSKQIRLYYLAPDF